MSDQKSEFVRLFSGLVLEHEAAVVTEVLVGSPAECAGFAIGDVIESINGEAVRSPEHFLALVKGEVSVVIQREHQSHTIELQPVDACTAYGLEVLIGRGSGPKANRECDANCNCSIKVPPIAVCQTFYVVKGNGPRGGVLLEKNCTFSAMPPGGPGRGGKKNCGTKEYF